MNEWSPRTCTAISEAIRSRRSMRAFQQTPVGREVIETILQTAARAPSGSNTQPWKVHVVSGSRKEGMSDEIVEAYLSGADHSEEYQYYIEKWREPYLARRRAAGWGLYGLLDISKGDKEKMKAQHARNFRFFDAPIGLIFSIDRDLGVGSWLDYGMFLQSIMIGAREYGLDTCPQQAFALYHEIIRRHLRIPHEQIVICGMALGYADMSAPENTLVTEREPLPSFVTYVGDDE